MKNLIVKSLPMLRGGPDFHNSDQHTVDCGSMLIEFYVPANHINVPGPAPLHRDIDLSAPPEKLCRTEHDYRTEHKAVKLKAATWPYWGPWWRCGNEPYVIVSPNWKIERVKGNISLEPGNLEHLQDYLEEDYLKYFEGEGGPNHRVKREAYDFFSSRPRPIEEYANDIKNRIEARARKLPDDYKLETFGDMKWLSYTWAPNYRWLPDKLFYSCLLDAYHILTVTFHLTEMVAGFREAWMPRVWEDAEKVMTGTKVHYRELPGKTGSSD